MHCTLFIPGLFGQAGPQLAALPDDRLPGMSRLLARAAAKRYAAIGTSAWLCEAWEVPPQPDYPVAALTLPLDGGTADERHWLRADPAHIEVGRSGLMLIEPDLLSITPDEAAALSATINRHLESDGLRIHALNPARWYLASSEPFGLETLPLDETPGRDLGDCQPRGRDALRWHRLTNEIQMLLHEHPVNAARDDAGAPAINSIWLWGSGAMPRVPGRPYGAVWSDEPLAQALSTRASTPCLPVPPDAAGWFADRDYAVRCRPGNPLWQRGRVVRPALRHRRGMDYTADARPLYWKHLPVLHRCPRPGDLLAHRSRSS